MSIPARALHGINACLIPLPSNDHRPLALRHRPLAFVSALLITTKLLTIGIISLVPAQAELSTITINRIVQLTNAERTKSGLPNLTVNSKLAAAAQEKGQHMLQEDYFAHISPSGVTPWFWISKAGYSYQIAGENLAIDFAEAEDVVAAWLASPSHKANMLHQEYTETGVAVLTGEFEGSVSTIVVHVFGKPSAAGVTTGMVEPTATPTAKESPTPAVPSPSPTPPPDTTPPRVPRITLAGGSSKVGHSVDVRLFGEPETTVRILINGQVRSSAQLSADGAVNNQLALDSFPDGSVVLRVYGTDSAGNQSDLSAPLVVEKDTQGPALAADQIAFLIAPAFDSNQIALTIQAEAFVEARVLQSGAATAAGADAWLPLPSLDNLTIELADEAGNVSVLENIAVAPQFGVDIRPGELKAPERFSALSRRLIAAILVSLFVLLSLAIMIRINIQRPALITHTSLVIVLAATLFFL